MVDPEKILTLTLSQMVTELPIRELPFTLPSLNIVIIRTPVRMSEEDFDALEGAIRSWRTELVKPKAPVKPEDD